MRKFSFSGNKTIINFLSVVMVFCVVFATLFGCGKEISDEAATAESATLAEEGIDSSETTEKTEKPSSAKKEKDKTSKAEKTTVKKKTYKSGTLANPMDLSVAAVQTQSKKSVEFQSLYDFTKGKFDFKEPSVHENDTMQSFKGSKEDALYIAEYAERLADECANFSMKEIYYQDFKDVGGEIFASWGLNYTGSASVKNAAEQNFVDGDDSCAISIYYMIKYGYCEGIIMWSNDLEPTDFGMRCGGYIVDVTPGGKSAGAGLKGTSDGKYQTSDSRLSASIGKSALIISGSKQSGSAVFEDTKYSDAIKIKNSNGSEIIKVFFPEGYTPKTGDVFYTDDLLTEHQWSISGEAPTSLGIDEMRVYQKVNGKWITPTYNDSPYSEALFRVMYYNASEGVGVFYLYTDTGSKTEMLCAVNLNNSVSTQGGSSGSSGSYIDIGSGSSGSGRCTHCLGKGYKDCLTCGGDGYYNAKVVTPNYAGSNNHHGTEYVRRPCPSYNCRGGKKDCPFC